MDEYLDVFFEPPIDGTEVDRNEFPEFFRGRVGIAFGRSSHNSPRSVEVIALRPGQIAALARRPVRFLELALEVFGTEEPGGPVRELPDEGEGPCTGD